MSDVRVHDLMVPVEKYATVSEDATLSDAVAALEEVQKTFEGGPYVHRAVLVLDPRGKVVGKLTMLDVLRALEPRYELIAESKGVTRAESRFGYTKDFVKSLIDKYGLWQKPLEHICEKASEIKVKEVMHTPTEGEFVEEDATLNEAIHQLILGQHQSLLVTRDGEIVGILRLSDVFNYVCGLIKTGICT